MKPIGIKKFLILLLLTGHVLSAVEEIEITRSKSILSRAIIRIVFEAPRRKLSTIHFIQNKAQQDDTIYGAVVEIRKWLAYAVEDIEQITDWYPRWFNIILVSGEAEFSSFVKHVNETNFDPRGFYVIVVETDLPDEDRGTISKHILETFSLLFYDNVIVLFRSEAKVLMYTFFPCDGTHTCYEVVPVLYNTFDGQKFEVNTSPFPPKWNDFNGCPISVATYPNPPSIWFTDAEQAAGVEAKILDEIASHLNFTIDYKIVTQPSLMYPNGTSTGTFNMLMTRNANLSVAGYTTAPERAIWLSASIFYLQTEIVYALPVSLEFGSLERHFLPLRKEIWVVFFAIHLGALIVLSLLKAFHTRFYYFVVGDHAPSPLLDMLQMFFGVGFYRTPRYTFARSMFMLWLVATFVLSTSYRGRLFEIMTSRTPKAIPHTIAELDDMQYDIYIRPQGRDFMRNIYGDDPRIKVETQPPSYYLQELQRPTGRRRSVLESAFVVKYFNARHYRDGVPPVLDEKLKLAAVCMFFSRNSYFAPPFDKILRHYVNGGLINKWVEDIMNTSAAKNWRPSTGPVTLSLLQFEGTFMLYAMVLGMSAVMLALELMSTKWSWLRRIVQFYTE